MRLNGDIIPVISGLSSLGINQSAGGAFDISTLAPFNRIHLLSGVYHDALLGTSGIIRFNQNLGCFEASVNGGISFGCVATTDNTVTSVGVLGDTNLTGNVDLASSASGFIVIEDSSGASPLLFSVNTAGLSGLWQFPANGFPTSIPRCYSETFGASLQWVATHNLGTTDVIVYVYDASSPRKNLLADDIETTDVNTVTVTFNSAQAGRVIILGC